MPVRLTKRHKFNARRTVIDGISFASQAEAQRYNELRLLEKAGEIRKLQCQPWFVLMAPVIEGGLEDVNAGRVVRVVPIGRYTADFSYERLDKAQSWGGVVWTRVVEDVKSKATRTTAYMMRKRHVEAQYGIEIVEVSRR